MAHLVDEPLQKFVHGKTIDFIERFTDNYIDIVFTDGQSLRIHTRAEVPVRPRVEVWVSPLDKNLQPIQSPYGTEE